MKILSIALQVPDDKEKEIEEKIRKIAEEGKLEVKGINITEAPPEGAGATLRGVAWAEKKEGAENPPLIRTTEEPKIEVSKEDFALLNLIKSRDFEDKQRGRLQTIKVNKRNIKAKDREIIYKRNQLKEKKSVEKHEAFLDGKKPLFMLESDIDRINEEIEQLKEINDFAQEEYDKDKNGDWKRFAI